MAAPSCSSFTAAAAAAHYYFGETKNSVSLPANSDADPAADKTKTDK